MLAPNVPTNMLGGKNNQLFNDLSEMGDAGLPFDSKMVIEIPEQGIPTSYLNEIADSINPNIEFRQVKTAIKQ